MDSVNPRYVHGFLPHGELQRLIDVLWEHGFHVTGPRVRDGVIAYDEVKAVSQLPQGYRDTQLPGTYRLVHTESESYFSWANGPQALKPLTFTAREVLWKVERGTTGNLEFIAVKPRPVKRAVIGVRPCDVAALSIQDQVFLKGEHGDPYYAEYRRSLFLIVVNCHYPAATCFCSSTANGPKANEGYDLVLSELADGFIIQAGSGAGEAVLAALSLSIPSDAQFCEAGRLALSAARQQQRKLDKKYVGDKLFSKLEHGQWESLAERCLSCGNCTMVCPTCFCHGESDTSTLDGSQVEHIRQWDSCFTQGHSYIHGLTIRQQTKHRYRQWLTHKFSSWYAQFGRSGCVGCGRCIAWCPVGIDIVHELALICSEDER